jgi:glutamate--cysteine ligase
VGIRNPGGDYNQLATTLLQIENEFYGLIRPKRVIHPGERPLHALRERGVEYIEVRCMDLDPFEPVGIAAPTMRFIDMFLLHCLLADSPPDSPQEIAALGRNQHKVAASGREPGLMLERDGANVLLTDWARELIDDCQAIAEALDAAAPDAGPASTAYREALAAARAGLDQPQSLPSARVLQTMVDQHGGSYVAFIRAQSAATRERLLALPYSEDLAARFAAQAEASVAEQRRIEAADTLPFEQYRQAYLSPDRLEVRQRLVPA